MRWLVLGFAALAYANTETVSFRLPLTQFDSLGPVRLSTERGTSLEPHRLVLGNLGVTRTALHAIDPASTPVSWVRRRVQDESEGSLDSSHDPKKRKQRRRNGESPRDLAPRRHQCELCIEEPRSFARPSALKIHMVRLKLRFRP